MIMANSEEKGMVPPADLQQTPIAGDEAEKEKLLKHEEAAKALGSKVDSDKLKGGYTAALLLAVFASTIGGSFQFGYHIGCINVPQQVIKEWYVDSHEHLFGNRPAIEDIAKIQWSITVGLFAVGGMIGGLLSGWVADRLGRKGAMFANNVLAVIGAILMASARYVNIYPLIMIGRVVIGVNCGISSGLVPMYLTEISPVNLRGAIGSVNQLLVTIAILFSQIIGLPQVLGTRQLWPLIFAFTIVPVILQMCTLPFCVESPKYTLIVRDRAQQAEIDLKKLRNKEDVSAEMDVMREEAAAMAATEKVSMPGLFKGDYRWPMFIAIMMMMAQQFSGINVAMFFSTAIFEGAGLGANAIYATLGMGLCNVIMTLVSVYLVDHPKFGRRLLLLIGLAGMMVTSILLTFSITLYNADKVNNQWASYPSMVFVFLFVIAFATGPGSIPWFFVSELFDSGARGAANSIAANVNWTSNFIVGTSWEFLNQTLNQYAFLLFAGFLAFFIFFTWVYVPETKGRSVEDINAEMKRGKSIWARRAKQ
uniref:Major facilitator superfamily (MFS) profile domain-containing protein n=2 Tax=Parascaris univalens TaxID=6257 RepID=A0A915BHL9_PARUN